jgi:hypothetical protein
MSSVPEFHLIQLRNVMDYFVAASGDTRNLFGFDCGQQIGVGIVHNTFFEGPRTCVAVQTFSIVEMRI